jgi:outer membrane protein TolC
LASARAQIARQAARVRQLQAKLSQLLGEQAWRGSGLGTPEDIDKFKRRITELEQEVVELTREMEERGEELDAAPPTAR